MLITKAINNNVVLAEDDNGRELVLFGKGLGFRGAPSHLDDESCIQRSFRDVSPELYEALASISAEVIIIASGIVDIARQELNCALNPNLIFTIADHLQFAIDRSSYSYVRFVTHMRFLISRLIRGEKFESRNGSLFKQAAKDFSDEYACARAIDEYLRSSHGWSCTDEELLYLMMHVNRLCASYSRS
ncbi:CAT RNA binding domain-containing protein [Paratractidigestivibacter sp.]|uniref:CAT RNA binding domain-containing protein n=1 Tax=Paratractidigestivibacter sp. TaxID=2847316 RepID=UPI002AC9C04E|nr:PRD domain-containing protein [Paratractidigestivibacter sp.]